MRALILAWLVVLAAVATAAAQGADAKKQAKAAFERAEAAEARKDWATAIVEFQTAYDLVPHPDVLYNIATNFERLEEYRDAATYYRRYLDEAAGAPDRKKIEKLITSLKHRPGEVTIISYPSDAEVELDGKRVGRTPLVFEVSGTRTFVISADGVTREQEVTVEFGEPERIEVELSAPAARSGVLVVQGNVPGAEITIDGTAVGTVPTEIPLPAGTYRVVVSAPGWATLERPIDVPAEGSTQMIANLVRPLGYVEPVEPAPVRRYYMLLGGGGDGTGEIGGIGQWMLGFEQGHFGAGLGYGYANQATMFGFEARAYLTTTKVRPYARAVAMLGTYSSLFGAAGLMATYRYTERGALSVFADVGVGMSKIEEDVNGATRVLIVPVIAGILFTY